MHINLGHKAWDCSWKKPSCCSSLSFQRLECSLSIYSKPGFVKASWSPFCAFITDVALFWIKIVSDCPISHHIKLKVLYVTSFVATYLILWLKLFDLYALYLPLPIFLFTHTTIGVSA